MTSKFWDDRYNTDDYVYGTTPNMFFKENILKLPPGKILLPAEGEGRNAVFASKVGWQTEAFDISEKGKEKALLLATNAGVNINYQIMDLEEADFMAEEFDVLALIYVHIPSNQKEIYFSKLLRFLKKGGSVLFEGFSKDHVRFQEANNSAGGPKDIDMLFSINELKSIFKNLDFIQFEESIIIQKEGAGHQGNGSVIRMVGKKK